MKLWITGPKGDLGGLRPALEKRWNLTAKDSEADVAYVEPLDNEFHGDLLTRLWVTEIRDSSDPEHIISEIDFIPVRTDLRQFSKGPLHLIGTHYVRREYPAPGASPESRGDLRLSSWKSGEMDPLKSPGALKTYEQDGIPLIAPWFLYLRMTPRNLDHLPPETWLGAAGPYNDAANLALKAALDAGFVTDEPDWGLVQGQDAWPVVHGVRYPRLGTHAFFASSFGAPADKELCWGLKAGDHFSNVRAMLR